MKKYIFTIIVAAVAQLAEAQQDVNYSLYLFNRLPYNPAVAAEDEMPVFTAHHRSQWLDLEGGPKTFNFNFQTPFAGKRNALGLGFTTDKIGFTRVNSLQLAYAYRIPLTTKIKLALGLQGLYDQARIDWTEALATHANDPDLPLDAATEQGVNFGAGAQLQGERFYVGASVPRFLPAILYSDKYLENENYGKFRTAYAMAGYRAKLSQNLDFQPSVLLALVPNAPMEIEVAGQFIFKNKVSVGANWRHGDSVDLLAQYTVNRNLRIGLSYDLTTSKLKNFTSGSFDLMLRYLIPPKDFAIENLRFF